jgi:hypothetical protein
MECVPVVEKVCVNVAVAPAPDTAPALVGTAATVPIVVVPSLNTTFPVAPVTLLLCDEIVAVNVTGVAVVTPVVGLAPTPVAVTAGVTVTVSTVALAGAL